MTKPITPEEVRRYRVEAIPDRVIFINEIFHEVGHTPKQAS